jgi:carbon storage regulator
LVAGSHPASLPLRKEPSMLVLSRHRDESIIIGDDIIITVVDVRGDKVRLGIDAPTDIPVHRQEVYEAIQRERRAQANASRPSNPEEAQDPGKR